MIRLRSSDPDGAMTFASVAALREAGFTGFYAIRDLWESRLTAVPAEPGVYVVVRPSEAPPNLLLESPAGRFKGRDPTIPVEELRDGWTDESPVVYIGKAGGPGTRATLRSRLSAYIRHGYGSRAAHWGGRAIWQLANAPDLLVGWRSTSPDDPRDVERAMIAAFTDRFGQRPFANRTG